MASDKKMVAEIVRTALKQGWGFDRGRGRTSHPALVSPQGQRCSIPYSPGGHRTIQNLRAQLRRAGLEL